MVTLFLSQNTPEYLSPLSFSLYVPSLPLSLSLSLALPLSAFSCSSSSLSSPCSLSLSLSILLFILPLCLPHSHHHSVSAVLHTPAAAPANTLPTQRRFYGDTLCQLLVWASPL